MTPPRRSRKQASFSDTNPRLYARVSFNVRVTNMLSFLLPAHESIPPNALNGWIHGHSPLPLEHNTKRFEHHPTQIRKVGLG
jgi:hypothetical protein